MSWHLNTDGRSAKEPEAASNVIVAIATTLRRRSMRYVILWLAGVPIVGIILLKVLGLV